MEKAALALWLIASLAVLDAASAEGWSRAMVIVLVGLSVLTLGLIVVLA